MITKVKAKNISQTLLQFDNNFRKSDYYKYKVNY